MAPLPGWLTKRARDGGFTRIVEVLAPATLRSQAIYVLTGDNDIYELHVVDDAMSGIDGVTIPLTRREAFTVGSNYLGALSGRVGGVTVKSDSPSGNFHDGTPLAARTGPIESEPVQS